MISLCRQAQRQSQSLENIDYLTDETVDVLKEKMGNYYYYYAQLRSLLSIH